LFRMVAGAATILNNVQLLYMLPVSLFGMSIQAAELPAMSSVTGEDEEVAARLRERLGLGLRRIAFFIVPSAVAFLAFGDLLARVVFEGGEFGNRQVQWVWGVLAGSAVGLLASTLGRLYASALYALRDTRTPLRFAMVRVALTTALGLVGSLWLPGALGLDPRWAVTHRVCRMCGLGGMRAAAPRGGASDRGGRRSAPHGAHALGVRPGGGGAGVGRPRRTHRAPAAPGEPHGAGHLLGGLRRGVLRHRHSAGAGHCGAARHRESAPAARRPRVTG
jgi:hypothetical protein